MSGVRAADRRRSPRQQASRGTARKSLKTLQHVATDKENLTGRTPFNISKKSKDMKVETEKSTEKKNKNVTSTGTQAQATNKVTVEDLTSDAGPSEDYWQVLAEKRRMCLEDTLRENKELHAKIELLQNENLLLKQMVEDSKGVVDVLREMITEQESGIDLGDESCLSVDESHTEAQTKADTK